MHGLAAVILAGGTGARMGGVDKATLSLAGRPLIDHALEAVAEATEIVVVGPPLPGRPELRSVIEDPPLGGPVAGVYAGRDALVDTPELLAIIAVDMPGVTAATIRRLAEAADGCDGALLVDAAGRRQLAGVLRLARFDAVRPAHPHGMPWHRVIAGLDLADVPATGPEARDIDTWADLEDTD